MAPPSSVVFTCAFALSPPSTKASEYFGSMPMPCESWPVRLAWIRFSVTRSTFARLAAETADQGLDRRGQRSARMMWIFAMNAVPQKRVQVYL